MNRILCTIRVAMVIALTACCGSAASQGVADRVRLTRGTEAGEVTNMTATQVTLAKGLGGNRELEVNEIRSIQFDDEPSELSQARLNAGNGAYENALALLAKIDVAKVNRDFIKQDIEFYKGWCAGKLAMAGKGEISDAGRQLNAFVRAYPTNYHYLAAREAMGDLLMAGGGYANAEKQYAELAKAPWQDYKMRAAVAVGRSLQAQNKHAEAIKQFDAALAMPADDAAAQNERLAATLARAVSLSETGGVEEAVGIIEKVIHDADPQQKELHARAYNSLGTCYEKAGKNKEALLAFLHVDVLYNTVPEAHAEALSHLVKLWKAIGQEERARESRQTLTDRYAGSRWAKQVE
jgi:tetratricopeptide (TPR) repeat protein